MRMLTNSRKHSLCDAKLQRFPAPISESKFSSNHGPSMSTARSYPTSPRKTCTAPCMHRVHTRIGRLATISKFCPAATSTGKSDTLLVINYLKALNVGRRSLLRVELASVVPFSINDIRTTGTVLYVATTSRNRHMFCSALIVKTRNESKRSSHF